MARVSTPEAFARDLLEAAVKVPVASAAVVAASAPSLKAQAQANVRESAPVHNAGAHRAITYDTPSIRGFSVESAVGYDKGLPGGALGNLLEYGGGGDKSPAHRDIGRAADAEEPRFMAAVAKMATELL